MSARRFLIVAAVVPVLALAACGGGHHRLTAAEYDAAVNRLCLRAADQFREMHLLNTMDDWQRNAARIVRIRVRFSKEFAALKPPAFLKTNAAAFLGANENALADDRIAIAAAQAGDYEGFLHGIRAEHSDNRSGHRSAQAIGASGCYIP